MRWTGSSKLHNEGRTFLYSGHDKQHGYGVGMVLSKEAASALIQWKPVSNCRIMAHFQSRQVRATVIQAYALTEEAEGAEKMNSITNFRRPLANFHPITSSYYRGNMNAQISNERQGMEHVVGPYGTARTINYNGAHFFQVCNKNALCIGNIFLAHKAIHKKN